MILGVVIALLQFKFWSWILIVKFNNSTKPFPNKKGESISTNNSPVTDNELSGGVTGKIW